MGNCFIIPTHRRRGIGRMIMDAFTEKADELGLEAFCEATPLGALLYKKYGFISPGLIHIKAPMNENPSPRWKELEKELLPVEFLPMWRPVGGKLEENIKKPWDMGE